jgi:hypothetical protein
MADQPAFTQADVDSLGQKLTQFKQTLTEGEAAAMATVIQRGMPQAEDVAGYIDRRSNEGAVGAQDQFGLIGNIFSTPTFDRKGPRGL